MQDVSLTIRFVLVVCDSITSFSFLVVSPGLGSIYTTSGHLNRAVRPVKGKSAPKH